MNQISKFIDRIGKAVLEEGKEIFEDSKHQKTIGDSIIDDLSGEPNKKYIPPRPHTKEFIFLSQVLHRGSEIITCNENLKNFPLFLRSFPYTKNKISRLTYLKYHYGNYLNEIYILKLRLISFLTILERLYRKPSRNVILHSIKRLKTVVEESFSGIVKSRGYHVHRQRIEHPLWKQVELMELFMSSKDPFRDVLSKFYLPAFRKVRTRHLFEMQQNKRAIKKLINDCFRVANNLVFNPNGKVQYPWIG